MLLEKEETLQKWLAMTRFFSAIHDSLEAALQPHGLSLNEFYVLYYLSQTAEKELRLQQLQKMIGLSQSAMSRLVVRLEAASCGALERHSCQLDRRGIYTRITPFGEEKLQRALDAFFEALTQKIQVTDLGQVHEMLRRMDLSREEETEATQQS